MSGGNHSGLVSVLVAIENSFRGSSDRPYVQVENESASESERKRRARHHQCSRRRAWRHLVPRWVVARRDVCHRAHHGALFCAFRPPSRDPPSAASSSSSSRGRKAPQAVSPQRAPLLQQSPQSSPPPRASLPPVSHPPRWAPPPSLPWPPLHQRSLPPSLLLVGTREDASEG